MIKNKSGTLIEKFQFIRAVAIDKTIMIKNKSGTLIEKFD